MSATSVASPSERPPPTAGTGGQEPDTRAPAVPESPMRTSGVTEFAVKRPTIPIPFHRLLKVVALVDRDDPQTRQLLDQIANERFEIEVTERLRSRCLRGRRGRRLHRLDRRRATGPGRKLGRAVRALGFRTPLWALADSHRIADIAVLEGTGEVDGYIYLGQQTPAFYAKQVIASIVDYGMSLLPPFFGGLMAYDARGQHRLRLPGPPGRPVLPQVAGRPAVLQAFRRERLPQRPLQRRRRPRRPADPRGRRRARRSATRRSVFGADQTYFVLNGTSTSNKVVTNAVLRARRPRAVRPQQPQVAAPGRAGPGRRDPDLPADGAQRVRHDRRGRLGRLGRDSTCASRSARTRW